MTGIYLITNTHNGKSYVGQSSDITRRWKQHTQSLPAEPPVSLIQCAFYKYGLRQQVSQPGEYQGFVFEILEECRREDLNERELHWIGKLEPQYNVALSPANPDIRPLKEKTKTRHIV
jgi:group I intron endonuclease